MRQRLHAEAAEAEALADTLAHQTTLLEHADRVRGLWWTHTAETRAAVDRAKHWGIRKAQSMLQQAAEALEQLDTDAGLRQ